MCNLHPNLILRSTTPKVEGVLFVILLMIVQIYRRLELNPRFFQKKAKKKWLQPPGNNHNKYTQLYFLRSIQTWFNHI